MFIPEQKQRNDKTKSDLNENSIFCEGKIGQILILLDLVTSLFNKEQFLTELPVLIPKLQKEMLYS